jgi:hypothetical protein
MVTYWNSNLNVLFIIYISFVLKLSDKYSCFILFLICLYVLFRFFSVDELEIVIIRIRFSEYNITLYSFVPMKTSSYIVAVFVFKCLFRFYEASILLFFAYNLIILFLLLPILFFSLFLVLKTYLY